MKPPRQTAWRMALTRLERRIDALSLRERAILFLTLAFIGAAVCDHLVLTGARQPRLARAGQLAHEAGELTRLRARLSDPSADPAAGAAATPPPPLRQEMDTARQRLVELDRQWAASVRQPASTTDLPALLTQVLRRHEQLTLLRLAPADGASPPAADAGRLTGGAAPASQPTLARQAAAAIRDAVQSRQPPGPATLPIPMPATAASTPAAAPTAPGRGELRWQSVDLSVSGPYLELLRYLRTLETQLPGLRWGALELDSAPGRAPVLTLRLTLVSAL
ncbi:hypothetical protein C7444_109147 [Sphaerotilus hippei]|uniref:MSHA biogenesis protein MshJ n=1 Tax=Sphaerotilus hippei TaxID=744406 RepID=A0A318GZ84_9BURK|nr:hypothetical protein [Sphaerotilus hippei]PXW95577.1 hypothetical protein C7444_109147 [Sphaerotilus hippei]